jgi:hypothetical protein
MNVVSNFHNHTLRKKTNKPHVLILKLILEFVLIKVMGWKESRQSKEEARGRSSPRGRHRSLVSVGIFNFPPDLSSSILEEQVTPAPSWKGLMLSKGLM